MSRPDCLLVVTTSYPRVADGSEAAGSFVADLVEVLAEHLEVRVVAPGNAAVVERVSPRIVVHRFPAPDGTLANLRVWHPLDALRILSILRSGGAAAERAAADGRVRHTLALWALPSGYWARRLWRMRKIPYSVWMLGSDIWSLGRIPVIRSVLRNVMRSASNRYADGFKLAEDCRRICGLDVAFLPTTRSLRTQHGRSLATQPPYRLVFIGRWHPNKGIDLLLSALAKLEDSDWKNIDSVEIYGGGPLESLVRERVATLREQGRPVAAGGYLTKADAEAAITHADWLLIPSRIESIPVVFSDAMKLGRPVIAMPTGDLPRLISETPRCGVLADSLSDEGFCRALKEALRTSPQGYAEGVQRVAAYFDLPSIANCICQEISENAS